ncbi:MAG: ATP-dependent DNA helicase RecG [Sciscionella sp.]
MTALDDKLDRLLGAKTAKALATALDLHTAGDLLRHYPRRYQQHGELTEIASLELGEHVTVLARVETVNVRSMRARRGSIVQVKITDGHSRLELAFFNQKWQADKLIPGTQALFAGKVTVFNQNLQLTHPEYQLLADDEDLSTVDGFLGSIIPVYPAAQGLPTWTVARCVRQVLDTWDPGDDPLPEALRSRHGLITLEQALRGIHRPQSQDTLAAARRRLKWDEALAVQLTLAQRRHATGAIPAPVCQVRSGGIAEAFGGRLPFELTEGQLEVAAAVAHDLARPHPMNRLLQGEVGSGKTIVALRAMLQVVDAGRQAALLAPTEVLAAQHFRSLSELLGDLGRAGELGGAEQATRLTLLTGSLPAAARKQALLDAVSGAAGIVIGTHALIQEHVRFADLGFVVVDEQHRFGVEQRDALRARGGDISPHVLVMTATPIPRTVAMTVYGDLEVSSLRELPAGRSPISTSVVPVAEKPAWLDRAWQRIREEVESGHQAYVVCPRIGDEPAAATEDGRRPPLAVVEVAAELSNGALSGLRVGVLHGRLPADEKDATMRAFTAGELDVLVATTVVEVGVNVPNATAMVIMDADRFGISQLHQLRGRVGRGSAPGVCLLTTEVPAGTTTRERLAVVASTVDGFELARADLELRREGDILGASQSGKKSALKLLSLLRDEDLIAVVRDEALRIVADDPDLAAHPGLAAMLAEVLDTERAAFLEKA